MKTAANTSRYGFAARERQRSAEGEMEISRGTSEARRGFGRNEPATRVCLEEAIEKYIA
jgi:hypothetical protein